MNQEEADQDVVDEVSEEVVNINGTGTHWTLHMQSHALLLCGKRRKYSQNVVWPEPSGN